MSLSGHTRHNVWAWAVLALGIAAVMAVIVWVTRLSGGNPDPTSPDASRLVAAVDIGVLVFREGLEAILVLAALTANLKGGATLYRRPIGVGVVTAMAATILTWLLAVRIIDDLGESVSALNLQAATGLLAIVVLVVVMNWFFHKFYWTGWISAHTRRKQELLKGARPGTSTAARLWWGLGLLGFSSFYREGFEVVLFLQSYRLKLGTPPVLYGVTAGVLFTALVAVLTFVAHRRLPYRRMLVLTGVMLGIVLVVMVGEQAQEMQLAQWLPTTEIPGLARVIPEWMGLWFACFPTVETLAAQALAILLVLGSYVTVRVQQRETRVNADSLATVN